MTGLRLLCSIFCGSESLLYLSAADASLMRAAGQLLYVRSYEQRLHVFPLSLLEETRCLPHPQSLIQRLLSNDLQQ